MTKRIFKAILIGALIGAAIFFMPFHFRFFLPFLFIFFAFRFFAFRRGWQGRGFRNYYGGYDLWNNPAYAEKWRSMSQEERSAFMKKVEQEFNNTTSSSTKENQ